MESMVHSPLGSSNASPSVVDKGRRFSLRLRKSFDDSFEMTDENFFLHDRKVAALQGFHFAAFTVDTQTRPEWKSFVSLIEDQGINCLDADNPDCWTVRVHAALTRSNSFPRRGRSELSHLNLTDSPLTEKQPEIGSSVTNGVASSNGTDISVQKSRMTIGRVNAVCLSRNVVGTQRVKRDPREMFREDVISISNRQQEAKMKRRYAATEMLETEREYCKAIKPLADLLSRLMMEITIHSNDGSETTVPLPAEVCRIIHGLRNSLQDMISFSEKVLLERLANCLVNPQLVAQCFIENFSSLSHYTHYFTHLENLIKEVQKLPGFETDGQFPLAPVASSKGDTSAESGSGESIALWNRRNSLSFRYLLELADLPRIRLVAYRGLLRDLARYTARAESDTQDLEQAMICIARLSRRSEEGINLWQLMEPEGEPFEQFQQTYYNEETGMILPPALIRLTDLKINERHSVKTDNCADQNGRLVLMPGYLVFLQRSTLEEQMPRWKICWMHPIKSFRIGEEDTTSDVNNPWFDLWNVNSDDPVKHVLRVYCHDAVSQNAWLLDLREDLMSQLGCDLSGTEVSSQVIREHQEADLERRLRYAVSMELPELRDETIGEVFLDAIDNAQQIQPELVTQRSHAQPTEMEINQVSSTFDKSYRSEESVSSSYHTAEEPPDEELNCRTHDTSVTLYESYTTLDSVTTPFSEDQQSLLDEQFAGDDIRRQSTTSVPPVVHPRPPLSAASRKVPAPQPAPPITTPPPLIPPENAVTKTITVHAGEQVQFNASFTISGPVAYEVQWFMNGQPIPRYLNADMILSDSDTRMLIAHADPSIHSGTYTCRCRLFEGTETAVYFYVNVTPKESEVEEVFEEMIRDQEASDSKVVSSLAEDRSIQLQESPVSVFVDSSNEAVSSDLEKIVEQNLSTGPDRAEFLTAITSLMDVAVGQVLELRVKVDRQKAQKATGNQINWEHATSEWCCDGQSLTPSSKCRMYEDGDTVVLQICTSDCLPGVQFNYSFSLQLSQESQPYQVTIPVHVHSPTKDELSAGFIPVDNLLAIPRTGLRKVVSISEMLDIQLIQGQKFRLIASLEHKLCSDDPAIWWTLNGNQIASRGRDDDSRDLSEFRCFLNRMTNAVKLTKPAVDLTDAGLYVCWLDDSDGHTGPAKKVIEYSVSVLTADEEGYFDSGDLFVESDDENVIVMKKLEPDSTVPVHPVDQSEKVSLDRETMTLVEEHSFNIAHATEQDVCQTDLAVLKTNERIEQADQNNDWVETYEILTAEDNVGRVVGENNEMLVTENLVTSEDGHASVGLIVGSKTEHVEEVSVERQEEGDSGPEDETEPKQRLEGENREITEAEEKRMEWEKEKQRLGEEEIRREQEEEKKTQEEQEKKKLENKEKKRLKEEEARRQQEELETEKQKEAEEKKREEEKKRRLEEEEMEQKQREEELKKRRDEEEKRLAEEEVKRQQEEEKKKREEEKKRLKEEEKKRRDEEEKRLAEEEAKRQQEEKIKKREEEKKRLEEEEKRKQEEEKKRLEEEEKKRRDEEEKRLAEKEAKRQQEEEKKKREEEKKKLEEEEKKKQEEEKKRLEEEEKKRRDEEEKRLAEEEVKRQEKEKKKLEEEAKKRLEEGEMKQDKAKRRKQEENEKQIMEEEEEMKWRQEEEMKKKHEEERGNLEEEINQKEQKKREKKQENAEKRKRELENETLREEESEKKREEKKERKKGGGKKTEQEAEKEQSGEPKRKGQERGKQKELKEEEERGKEGQEGNRGVKGEGEEEGRKVRRKQEKDAKRKEKEERGRKKQQGDDLEKAPEKEETDDLQSGKTIKEHVKKGDEEKREPDQEMKTEEYDRHEKRREGQGRGRELENKDNKNSGTIERDVVTKSIEIEAVNVMQKKEERDDIRETMECKAKLMDEKKNKAKKLLPEGEPKISETNDVVLAEAVEGNLLNREYETVDGNLKKPETDRETPVTEKLKIGDRNVEDVEDKAGKSHKKGKRKSKESHAECKKLEDLEMPETQSVLEGETMRKQSEDNYRTQLLEDMNKEEKREKKLKKSKKHGKPEESHLNEYEGWSQQRLAEDLVNLAQQADLGPSELRFGSTGDWGAQRSEREKHRKYGDAMESLDESVGLFNTSVSPEFQAKSLSPVTVKSYKEQDERVISEAFVVDPVESNKLRVLVNRAFDLSERYVVQVLEGTPLSMELQSIPIEAVRAVWSRREETIQDVLIDRVNRQTAESENWTESITDTGNLRLQFSSFDSQDVDTYRLDLYVPVGPRPEEERDHDEISEAKYELLKSIEIPVELVKRYPEPKKRDGQQLRQQPRQQLFSIVDEICTNLDYPVRETASVCLAVQCPNQGLEMTDSDFEWLCDGQPIVLNSSDRFHPDIIFESNPTRFLTKLIIPSVRKCDTGQYTIRLTSAGRARLQHAIEDGGLEVRIPVTNYTEFAFPRLRVQPLISEREIVEDERDASTFFDKGLPSHCSFREAERATLEVRLNPAVRIQDYMWFFNGKPINPETTADFSLSRLGNTLSITFPHVRPDLTGNYEVWVLGDQGSVTSSTRVDVQAKNDRDTGYRVTSADGLKPLFTKRLHDCEVDLGDFVRFTARVMAEPAAAIVWKHNGQVVFGDHRIRLFNDDANPSLTIRNVRPKDRGRYSCIATNPLGRVETEAFLYIIGVEHVEHDYFDDDYEEEEEVAVHETDIRKPITALPNEAPQLRVTNFDPSSFTVDWKPLMQTGVTYTVELSKDGGKWWRPVLTGLQNTSAYITSELGSPLIPLQIRVLAENEYGLGPASTPIQIPIRACLPVMPDIRPEIEFEDASSVLIRWPSATPSVGESQMLGDHVITPLAMLGSVTYAVELREGARAEWRRVTDNIHGQTHVHHLRPGVSSAIRIVAVNKFGESSPTPIAITHLDPSSLAPNIDLAPPWVALIRPHTETGSRPGSTAQIGLVMYWKPAYMPEYCESCVKGLDPVYRIEWRRGRGGIWQLLEDDVTDPETGFRLPTELVSMLLDDLKRVGEPTNSNNQALELRVFSWNQFGESGPTKPCRLFASQLFRGQIYKNTALALDRDQAPEFPEHWNDADQLPTVSLPEQCPRLNTYIHSINPTDGVSVSWQRYVDTGLLSGTEINPDSHARYRIERTVSSSPDHRSPLSDQRIAWRVTNVDEALIYGENCVLDLRPGKTEQYVRVLALNEARNRRVWVDAYKLIRIPPLSELIPSSPTTVTVHAQPNTDSNATSSVEHVIQWIPAEQTSWFDTRPANRDHDNLGHEEPDSSNPSDLHYRIEARTTLSDMAPWRQIAVVEHDSTSTIDRKPEPGIQLIYRVTPINIFGEGQSAVSAPIRTPVMFVNLEGCVEDLRYTILGPREIQLRWRLGDVAIDSLKHELDHGGQRMIPRSASMDVADRVRYNVEIRSGYAGEWTPVVENIRGNLTGKTALTDCEYLDRDIACRVVTYLEGQRTVPSRPVQLKLKTESLVPDLSLSKPHVSVESLDEYVISWEEPDVREIYPSHVLGLTTPQVLHRGMTYQVQVQRDGSKIWEDLSPVIQETLWTWSRPNPLKSYHVRLIAFNEFGPGMPSRAVAVPAQVVIPDLSFIRPTVELPADILAGATAPELVWQLPRAYTLDKTLTPVTYEVQVRGVARSARSPQQMIEESKHSVDDDECVWRVLETNLRRTRLALGRLDPEQEFWLRVVAVTDYGRGKPSQPVRKMVDLAARRLQRASASIGTLHEATPISPTFIDPKGAVMFAPLGGRLELKCSLKSMPINSDIRFSWFLNDRPIRTSENAYPQGTNRFISQVSKTGDSATLHIDGITDADFGVYSCRAVNIRGTALKEFTVIKADSPVFLDVPVPVLTIRLHSEFVLPCWVDALPEATLIWTRDSKRVVESHRTKIGAGPATPRLTSRTSKSLWQTTNASLSVERCIYQDAGLYTLVAENVAGRVQTSCLVRIEENPIHKEVSIRWTDIGKHYYVLRKIEGQMANEMRLLINKRTNQEYVGKLFPLDDPANRVCGAREFECLSRLHHTNVVELIDAVICDNTLVLIMEHLTGSNLLQAMLHCPTWSESVARAVVRQLLEALEHVHAAGVVHFDIHPENLIFTRNLVANSWDSPTAYTDLFAALSPLVTDTMGSGETDRHKLNVLSTLIKLVGFSAAEPLLSEHTGGCLPPHRYRCEYTSPEVLLALAQVEHDVTESASVSMGTAADMWSVGVLTYLLLTGWNPFMDPSTGEILRGNILNAEYSMDLEEFANVSEDAKSFIRALLQKDPRARPTASECLIDPWIARSNSRATKENVEYRLSRLPKYYELYTQTGTWNTMPTVVHSPSVEEEIPDSVDPASDTNPVGMDLHKRVKHRIQLLASGALHQEDSMSDLSSRASSIPQLNEALGGVDSSPEFGGRDFETMSNASITSVDDASEEINMKLSTILRQDTLTEASQFEDGVDEHGVAVIHDPAATPTEDSAAGHGGSPKITAPSAAPVLACPLRDAYYNIHLREARFSCQLAGFTHLPPGIHGHREAIQSIYSKDCSNVSRTKASSAAAVAAWYLGGCLLSDGPGVELGAGPGGWLWLCLTDLNPEQSGSVVECVIRNRAGKARTQARLLQADPPRPPGRPGLSDVRATEALVTWAPTDPTLNEDIIYRVDAKYSAGPHEPLSWYPIGFTVDCRYLITDLTPGRLYRVRVSAGNVHGWGNYSVASSEFQTANADPPEYDPILSNLERDWILTWRQNSDITALSDHPIAVRFNMSRTGSMPPPLSDKALQKLHENGGLISDLEVLREVSYPEYVLKTGSFSKLIVARTHPMLTEQAGNERDEVCLPARLLLHQTLITADNPEHEKLARQRAILLTGLNTSSGGIEAAVDDFFCGVEPSLIFTSHRKLLPCGWSLGWLANDAAKPTMGITVSHWVPGGSLLDVLCSRTEYSEFTIMHCAQQLLLALRWLHVKFYGRPHGCIHPDHILVARRTSALPDVVLSGLGSTFVDEDFTAPEVLRGEPVSNASDLWSLGAVVYLLMTGRCPQKPVKPEPTATETPKTGDTSKPPAGPHSRSKRRGESSGPATDTVVSGSIAQTKVIPTIEFRRLNAFTKPAKKFVYNTVRQVPAKRGTLDFWLSSKWFDLRAENVQAMTRTPIPATQLTLYRYKLRSRQSGSSVDQHSLSQIHLD